MKAVHTRLPMLLLSLALAGAARPALGQDDLAQVAGYVDFTDLADQFGEAPTLEVNIKGPLLKLVAEASREEDPELADLLLKLQAIQVRGYPLRRSQFRSMERRSLMLAERLSEAGWETVVNLRDYGQYVDMYVKQNPKAIEGMVLLVLDTEAGETVFINIVGDIDPGEMGRIGSKFTTTPLDDLSN
ncbi:MAG: DUF4252 domain-containing protein [Rhodothermales bacterium]